MRRPGNTIRTRFAVGTTGLVLVVFVSFGLFVYLNTATKLTEALDLSLRRSAAQLAAGLQIQDGQVSLDTATAESSDTADLRDTGLTVWVADSAGVVLESFGPFRSLPLFEKTSAASGAAGVLTTQPGLGKQPVRLYVQPVVDGGKVAAYIQVGQSLASVNDALGRLLAAMLLAGPVLMALAGVGSYLLVSRALMPIDRVTRMAQRISADDLSARLGAPTTNDEVGRLALMFDSMLERLDASFQRERRFTSDASHELRTPLATLQMILGVTRTKRRGVKVYEQALADASVEVDRLQGLVESLLLLGRPPETIPLRREPIEFRGLLEAAVGTVSPTAQPKGLAIENRVPEDLVVSGDAVWLSRLFVNLLENAVKFTEIGRVTVEARRQGAWSVVVVRDTGAGIPAADLPHLFERFYRADRSRSTPGSGLGLAIALEIAHLHGGRIEVQSTLGVGSAFSVFLPV